MKLNYHPHEAFFNKLKNKNITDEEYHEDDFE